jgi:glyoxylase-like metal-dependent hydrolase (beta-lactamase superfamily II)
VTTSFVEIADRCWVARHEWLDVNVSVVAGEAGLVVVDSLASARAAGVLVDALRSLSALPLHAVVNTHEHFDHTLGNATLVDSYGAVPVVAQEEAAARTVAAAERAKDLYRADPDDPHGPEVLATEPRPADRTFSSALVLDLGDRRLELVHPGRAHTGGDLVVRVPDADVLLAGDLVEESAPPSYGEDAWPLEWPATLDLVLELVGPATVVVPGHGAPVDRGFMQEQRSEVGIVAETIRDLAGRGVPPERALTAGRWPWPAEHLAAAVRRGYATLPRDGRRLPLA